ncbi:hypothetical protein ACQ4PT_011815 [Festuca glaucescens]
MANYDCNPFPHVPAGMAVLPPGPLHTQRGYVIVGGDFPLFCDDWAIATLAPAVSQNHFELISTTITEQLQQYGLEVRSISKCAMGSALVRFGTVTDRDAAINLSPMWIGDTSMRFVAENYGINRRATLLTHDVWVMLMNYPQECWELDIIMRTFVPYGRFLVWNKDMSNRARILVKIRAYNVDTFPLSIVVVRNPTEDGNSDSWTCPIYLLSRVMLGGGAGDEDPLPPHGGNPHPIQVYDQGGFWHDRAMNNEEDMMQDHDANPVPPAGHADGAPAAPEIQVEPVTPEATEHNDVDAEDFAADGTNDARHTDPINALRNLITNLIDNASELLPELGSVKFVSANCSIMDTEGPDNKTRKCIMQIDIVLPSNCSKTSSVRITEINEEVSIAETMPMIYPKAKK